MNVRFWIEELPLRFRSWWTRHWWPARIRQLDQEREYWKGFAKEEPEQSYPTQEEVTQTMDAAKWTDAFLKTFPNGTNDWGILVGWFANAIMAGYDHAARTVIPSTTREK